MNKNYEERLKSLKEDILSEINENLDCDEKFYFNDSFFIHYIEGECATTEYARGVFLDETACVGFIVSKALSTPVELCEHVNDVSIFGYDTHTFIDFLENLRKERAERRKGIIERIKNLLGDRYVMLDGSFSFITNNEDNANGIKSKLLALCVDKTDEEPTLHFETDFEGRFDTEKEVPFTELVRLEEYLAKADEIKHLLALTEEQKKAMEKIDNAIKEFHEAGGYLIFDHSRYTLRFANGKELNLCYADTDMPNKTSLDVDSLPSSGEVYYDGWGEDALYTSKV